MPMYDFQCTKCEHIFEEITPYEGPFPVCPECQSPTERLMTTVNFRVKKLGSTKAQIMTKKAIEKWKAKQGAKKSFPLGGKPPSKKKATKKY